MERITGKVIKVLDDIRVVINKGSKDGVTNESRFLVYYLGEELFDDETKKSLGRIEHVCGEGKPEHIQEKITTIVSDRYENKVLKKVVKRNQYSIFGENIEEIYDPKKEIISFIDVEEGTLIKQID